MKPLIVFSDVTVDGFMAGPDSSLASLDFIIDDRQLEDELAGKFGSVADTIVVGRQTFLDMAAYWTTVHSDLVAWLNTTPKVVLSTDSNFDVGVWKNSTLAAGDGVEQVRRLKASTGGALVMFGDVQIIRSMVAADLVDEYWLKVSPAIVGRGGSMFSDVADRRDLTLRGARFFPSGIIDAIYSPTDRQGHPASLNTRNQKVPLEGGRRGAHPWSSSQDTSPSSPSSASPTSRAA